jgi:hypothetical protein|nr:MAG TPA: hypothetical protein [Bacteriophage sp.]
MKILLEKIKKLEQLEKAADEAESRYTEESENAEFESAFDKAYKAEFAAYIDVARYIEHMTGGAIDFMKAKELIQTKRAELLQLLA